MEGEEGIKEMYLEEEKKRREGEEKTERRGKDGKVNEKIRKKEENRWKEKRKVRKG